MKPVDVTPRDWSEGRSYYTTTIVTLQVDADGKAINYFDHNVEGCEYCGNPIFVEKKGEDRKLKYCSGICQLAAQEEERNG